MHDGLLNSTSDIHVFCLGLWCTPFEGCNVLSKPNNNNNKNKNNNNHNSHVIFVSVNRQMSY